MRLLLIGTNHRCADVRVRERLAITPANVQRAYTLFRERYPGSELVILSTCNRSELLATAPGRGGVDGAGAGAEAGAGAFASDHPGGNPGDDPGDQAGDQFETVSLPPGPDATALRQLLAELSGLTLEEVTAATIHREQEQAAVHLFRTAAGLDSRILGEPQILGQIRSAYEQAVGMQTVGSTTHVLFQQALATAKRLRTRTGIGTSRHTVGTVAIDFARQVFSGFTDKSILLIGAGRMIQAVLPHLAALNAKQLLITNRTPANAHKLTDRCDGLTVRVWEDLPQLLYDADFIVTCTANPDAVISHDALKAAAKRKRYRPMCLADLGVPRNVQPECESIRNVYLYNIDDLQAVIADNQQADRAIAQRCETEIQAAAHAVVSRVLHRDLGRLIKKLRKDLHALGALEQDRTVQRLIADATGDPRALAAILAEHNHRLINKILHVPLRQLNQHDGQAPLGFYAAALRRLFNLQDITVEPEPDDLSDLSLAGDADDLLLPPPGCKAKPL